MDINSLPQSSGVYIFKDNKDIPIYLGKAINIRKRVKNHLILKESSWKEKLLFEKTKKIESIAVDSEIEALILEANLIKKLRPIFNSQLKDDKDYIYIKITKDKFPRVLTARKKDLQDAKIYFGPFPSASKARTTLKTLRKIFPYSTCKPGQKRSCLAYHIGLCPGVCAGKISHKEYLKNIQNLKLFLEGKKYKVLAELEKEMQILSKKLEFEKAASIQDKIEAISYITRPIRVIDEYFEEDLENVRFKEMEDLKKQLGLQKLPERIECYDISNILGKQAVGSMVVFTNAQSDKAEYRRFRIKTTPGINDPAMLAEVLSRRFKNDWPYPQLIIVDGGRTQLNATRDVVERLELSIPVVSLAKRFEEIYLPNEKYPLRLPLNSEALKLLRRIRDEAHRFAITYHRKLRSREFLTIR